MIAKGLWSYDSRMDVMNFIDWTKDFNPPAILKLVNGLQERFRVIKREREKQREKQRENRLGVIGEVGDWKKMHQRSQMGLMRWDKLQEAAGNRGITFFAGPVSAVVVLGTGSGGTLTTGGR